MFLQDVLGSFGTFVVAALFLILQTWLVTGALRRVLGVKVGLPRTFIVGLFTVVGLMSLVHWMYTDGALPTAAPPIAVLAYVTLIALWSFAIASAILVGLEMLVPTGSLPPLRSLLFGWGHRWRRGRRYSQILAIATKYGLGAQLRGIVTTRDASDQRTATNLRLALNEAGVTFIKLGQMLSTRADLLPPIYIAELSKLQNQAEPETWAVIKAELDAQLGRPVDEVLQVDPTPLASASVAQVHAATLADGTAVVVKIQRPGAETQMAMDVEILRRLADMWHRNSILARNLGAKDLVDGFGASLAEELDYHIEMDNMRTLRSSLDHRQVRIPQVYPELSNQRLIVMERFDGTPVGDAGEILRSMPVPVRQATAKRLLEAVLDQIINDGVFHADLHPGNVVIWPDGSAGLLDFGSVGRLDAVTRRTLGLLLWAIDADDPVLATDCLIGLLDRPSGLDDRALQRSIGTLLTRFRGGFGTGSGSLAVFAELFNLVIAHGFKVPPQLAAAMRSLGALEGTLTLVDPGLDLVAAARSVGRQAITEGGLEKVKDELLHRAISLLPIIDALPRQLGRLGEQLESGRFTMQVRVVSHPEDQVFLRGLVQQLVVAALAGFAVLGGIWLFTTSGGPFLLPGISWFAFLGAMLFFAGFMLALRAVAMVFGRAFDP